MACVYHRHYRHIGVIAQVKQYPGDERWIALSKDSYDQPLAEDRQALHEDCEREGIGLFCVGPYRKTTVLETPKLVSLPKGLASFLDCYACAEDMRRKLQGI